MRAFKILQIHKISVKMDASNVVFLFGLFLAAHVVWSTTAFPLLKIELSIDQASIQGISVIPDGRRVYAVSGYVTTASRLAASGSLAVET